MYHVTFNLDLDLEHTLDARLPGDHRVQVWWRSGQLSARRSDLSKSLQTDRRRTPHHCISSFLEWANNLITLQLTYSYINNNLRSKTDRPWLMMMSTASSIRCRSWSSDASSVRSCDDPSSSSIPVIFDASDLTHHHITLTGILIHGSSVRIFEILNRIEQLLQYLIRFETSTIIQNFQILTVTDFLLI